MLRKDARYWWESVKLRRNVHAMTREEFVREFNQKYYNQAAMRAKQKEFLNLKQGNMTVIEAVTKFEQLARLCPSLVATEEERTRKMMDMFFPDIALAIESGGSPPVSVEECVERALRVEYRLAQLKEERARKFEARKNQGKEGGGARTHRFHQGSKFGNRKNVSNPNKRKWNSQEQGGQRNTHPKDGYKSFPSCTKCGRQHPGECKAGTLNFLNKPSVGNQQGSTKAPASKAYAMQAKVEGPSISQGKLKAPEPNARIYAYAKGDAEAGTSNVVTEKELYVDLIVLDMYDYDVILGMDFLAKYNATIECRLRRVTFRPSEEEKFSFIGERHRKPKIVISAMEARKMISSGCTGYLASVVDTTKEEKAKPEDIPIVRNFVDVFPEELPGLPPDQAISFEIELLPGTAPVSKAPYRMAPTELKELQTQL
ncbi:hypothetical protein UlMin_017206 [Ulmus minor]